MLTFQDLKLWQKVQLSPASLMPADRYGHSLVRLFILKMNLVCIAKEYIWLKEYVYFAFQEILPGKDKEESTFIVVGGLQNQEGI